MIYLPYTAHVADWLMAAEYARGRHDGAVKQTRNYEAGHAIGLKVGRQQGFDEGYGAAQRINRQDDDYERALMFRNWRTSKRSMWERICDG